MDYFVFNIPNLSLLSVLLRDLDAWSTCSTVDSTLETFFTGLEVFQILCHSFENQDPGKVQMLNSSHWNDKTHSAFLGKLSTEMCLIYINFLVVFRKRTTLFMWLIIVFILSWIRFNRLMLALFLLILYISHVFAALIVIYLY